MLEGVQCLARPAAGELRSQTPASWSSPTTASTDSIGWVAGEQDRRPARVTMTSGHLAELRWLRGDVAMSIVTGLDDREDLTEADDIAALDEHLHAARLTVHGLWQILHAPDAEDPA